MRVPERPGLGGGHAIPGKQAENGPKPGGNPAETGGRVLAPIASRGRAGYACPAMADERLWAARYQFLEELWRGRDRIVFDPEVEDELHVGGLDAGPQAELLDALIPRSASGPGDGRTWMVLDNHRRAVGLSRGRADVEFLGLADASQVSAEVSWEVAVVDLGGRGSAPQSLCPTLDELDPELHAFLEVLGEAREDHPERSVVLTAACGEDEDAAFERLADVVVALFADARIYGMTRPGLAAFYDFGRVLEGEDSQGEPSIEVDNSLGEPEPRFDCLVAVVGARVPSEGVTFVELPGQVGGAQPDGDQALRVQLDEARRRVDLQAIEGQDLLEKVEQGEDRIAALEEQLEARPGAEGARQNDGLRLDAVLAQEQNLRWELERARSELEIVQSRPVETLEAALASAEAKLARTEATLADRAHALAADSEPGEDELEADLEDELEADLEDEPIVLLVESATLTRAQARAENQARAKVQTLLGKLERGAQISALELHRELRALLAAL